MSHGASYWVSQWSCCVRLGKKEEVEEGEEEEEEEEKTKSVRKGEAERERWRVKENWKDGDVWEREETRAYAL